MTGYTYDELQAIKVIRKAMLRKPEIIAQIMKGASQEMAGRVLIQARDELTQLLEVTRAFAAAASLLVNKQESS